MITKWMNQIPRDALSRCPDLFLLLLLLLLPPPPPPPLRSSSSSSHLRRLRHRASLPSPSPPPPSLEDDDDDHSTKLLGFRSNFDKFRSSCMATGIRWRRAKIMRMRANNESLQLDPTNDTVKENLKIAVQKFKEQFERHQNGRPGPSSSFNQGSRNHATGGSQEAPSPSPSFTFNVNSFPASVGNMFTNMFPNPHQGQDAHSRETANNHEDRTPPTYTSAPFDAGSIPANLASMFANFPGRASQGHNSDDQPQAGSDSTGYYDPGLNIGGNINVNFAEQMPEEVMGT